jgi:hypothetical protein
VEERFHDVEVHAGVVESRFPDAVVHVHDRKVWESDVLALAGCVDEALK